MVIKNIILPEHYGNYYLFGQMRLGFDITKKKVRVTQVLAKGYKRIIKDVFQESINQDQTLSYEERTSQAIAEIIKKIKKYDVIYTALPSSKVVFKELILPFKDYEKIAAIIRFEVEQYLPFPAETAFLDFIVTEQKPEETTILVAAVKQEYVEEHLSLFRKAGIEPQKVTIDAFELFGFYSSIPSYQAQLETVCLVDLELYTTRLVYIVNGRLIGARMLNKGISALAKTHEELEQFYRFGINEETDLPQEFKTLLRDIQFTLSSFRSSLPKEESSPATLLLFGDGISIKGLDEIICRDTPYNCKIFEIQRILEDPNISFATRNSIPLEMTLSLATALSSSFTQKFNLMPITEKEEKLINQQLLTAIILLSLLFLGLGFHAFFQMRKLRSEINASEKQAVNQLKSIFELTGNRLSFIVDDARREVERQEDIWFSLSPQARISILKYLEELSTLIDREAVGLHLNKLSISKDAIILEGSVRDYSALDVFQRELRRSKLFALETPLQDPNFKSIRLIISRNGQEY